MSLQLIEYRLTYARRYARDGATNDSAYGVARRLHAANGFIKLLRVGATTDLNQFRLDGDPPTAEQLLGDTARHNPTRGFTSGGSAPSPPITNAVLLHIG